MDLHQGIKMVKQVLIEQRRLSFVINSSLWDYFVFQFLFLSLSLSLSLSLYIYIYIEVVIRNICSSDKYETIKLRVMGK